MAIWIGEMRILLSESSITELTWLSLNAVVNCPIAIATKSGGAMNREKTKYSSETINAAKNYNIVPNLHA